MFAKSKSIDLFESSQWWNCMEGAVKSPQRREYVEELYIKGCKKTFRELAELKKFYFDAIEKNDFEEIQSYCFLMDRPTEVLFAGTTQATHDFRGNCLNRAVDLGLIHAPKADNLEFSLFQMGGKGVFVVSFP